MTTIGVGRDFDVELMRAIADVGAGSLYFLEDPAAVVEVFTEEARTFLVPLALDVRIEADVHGDFQLRRAYGTRGFSVGPKRGAVEIPSLFLAGRTSSDEPIETGRRGGGGGILLEILDEGLRTDPEHVASLRIEWTDPLTGERQAQAVDVRNPLSDGSELPDDGHFSDETAEKAFVMLNIYAAFELATERYADGDPGSAIGTLEALRPEVAAWLEAHPDPDIEDDLRYVDLFLENLYQAAAGVPVSTPPEPWPVD